MPLSLSLSPPPSPSVSRLNGPMPRSVNPYKPYNAGYYDNRLLLERIGIKIARIKLHPYPYRLYERRVCLYTAPFSSHFSSRRQIFRETFLSRIVGRGGIRVRIISRTYVVHEIEKRCRAGRGRNNSEDKFSINGARGDVQRAINSILERGSSPPPLPRFNASCLKRNKLLHFKEEFMSCLVNSGC